MANQFRGNQDDPLFAFSRPSPRDCLLFAGCLSPPYLCDTTVKYCITSPVSGWAWEPNSVWTDVRAWLRTCWPGKKPHLPTSDAPHGEEKVSLCTKTVRIDAQTWILYVLVDLLAEGNNALHLVQDEVRC